MIARDPMESRIERLCVERGLKMTGQRRVIARVLSDATLRRHLSADGTVRYVLAVGEGPDGGKLDARERRDGGKIRDEVATAARTTRRSNGRAGMVSRKLRCSIAG